MQKFRGGDAKNLQKKYGREIINYDLINLLILVHVSREFHKFLLRKQQLRQQAYSFSRNLFSRKLFLLNSFQEKKSKKFRNTNANLSMFYESFVHWKHQNVCIAMYFNGPALIISYQQECTVQLKCQAFPMQYQSLKNFQLICHPRFTHGFPLCR